jgi:predicted lipase
MTKTIELIVSPTVQTTVQTKGFAGSTCRDASSFIERALGTAIGEQPTAEFYQHQSQQQNLREGA